MMGAATNKIQPKSSLRRPAITEVRLALGAAAIIFAIMRSRAWQIIELSLAAASVLIQSTVAFAAENPGGTAAPKEMVSAWLRTRTNEWVRYHYPLVRLPVYRAGRLIQPAVTLKGWYETNHSPPVVERKIVSTRPPPPPPNLDDPKSLREYVIRHGLVVPEIVVMPDAACSGGS
jgi:hypothetical protein